MTNSIKNVTIHFETFLLGGGFKPIYETVLHVKEIPAMTAIEIPFKLKWDFFKNIISSFRLFKKKYNMHNKSTTKSFNVDPLINQNSYYKFLFQAKFNPKIFETFSGVLLPDKLYATEKYGQVFLIYLKPNLLKNRYLIGLKCTDIQPLVWLDLTTEIKKKGIVFYFENNGFAITKPKFEMTLIIIENSQNLTLNLNDFIVTVI